jgi:hypothetical protein
MRFDHESCSRLDSESVLKPFRFDYEALSLVLLPNPPPETLWRASRYRCELCSIQSRVEQNEDSNAQGWLIHRLREYIVGDKAQGGTL